MRKIGPEAGILKTCLQLLQTLHIPAWRSNSGCVSGSYTSVRTGITRKRFVKFAGVEGLSDITGILPECVNGQEHVQYGVFLAIEVKAPGNGITQKQANYIQMVQEAGGVALVVHSVDELLEDLREIGAVRDLQTT